MTGKLVPTLLVLGLAGNLHAEVRQSHQCERGGIERTVQLVSAEGSRVPCEVVYSKPMEDQSSTSLWNARNDAGFCQQKYDSFIVKLESKLNWSCSANTELPESVDLVEKPVEAVENAPIARSAPAATTPENTQTAAPTPPPDETVSISAPNDIDTSTADAASIESVAPEVLAALPQRQTNNDAEQEISLELIRQLFPTGHYTESTQAPHSGNTALCPNDGLYIWNTQRPDKPAFEMGANYSFIFNIGQFSNRAHGSVGGGSRTAQCDYQIQSSYCINDQLQSETSVSTQVANALACGSQSPDEFAATRQLSLISILSNPPTQTCSAGAPADSMGLASLPGYSTDDSNSAEEGLEVVMVANAAGLGSVANCRYVRGR